MIEWAMGGHEGDHVLVVRCERSWPGMCEDVGMGFVECKRYKEVGLVAVMGEEPAGAVMAGLVWWKRYCETMRVLYERRLVVIQYWMLVRDGFDTM